MERQKSAKMFGAQFCLARGKIGKEFHGIQRQPMPSGNGWEAKEMARGHMLPIEKETNFLRENDRIIEY